MRVKRRERPVLRRGYRRRLRLEQLENRWLMTNDLDDSIIEAQVLSSNVLAAGSSVAASDSISVDTDVDMYRVRVSAGQTVDFDIDTPQNGPGGLGSYLRLFDASGNQLAANNDASAPGENTVGYDAYLRFTFVTAGNYYIGVSNANNIVYDPANGSGDTAGGQNATGSYTLTVTALPVDADDKESTANSLGQVSATAATVNATIATDVDVDMYRFTVLANQTVDFDIDTTANGPGGLGSYLRLFNSQGQQIDFNNDAAAPSENTVGFDAYLRQTFTTGGTYYIGVSNANNIQYDPVTGNGDTAGGQFSIGPYSLTVNVVAPAPSDPDDQISEAIPLGAITTTPVTKSDSISVDTDVDMYQFTVTAGQTVDFDIDTTLNGPGGLGSYLRLFNSAGTELAFNNDGAAPGENTVGFDAYLRFTFATAGTYYIGVSNANNIQYNPTTGSGDTSGGLNSTGSYQLTVQALPADTDDTINHAISLGSLTTTPITKNDSINPDIDVDMYKFTVVAGQAIDFNIDTPLNGPGGLDSYLRLFNAQGQQLAVNDNAAAPGENQTGLDAYLRFTFAAAGTYYLGVSNANNVQYSATAGTGDTAGGFNSIGSYQLTVQIPPAAPADPDDTLAEATTSSFPPALAESIPGSITSDTDVDLYGVTVQTGQILDFDIHTQFNGPGGLDSYLRLFNAQGQQLAFNDNAPGPNETETIDGFDAYLRYTFAAGGTYYIGVSNANNTYYDPVTGNGDTAGGPNATGNYDLIVHIPYDDINDSLDETAHVGTPYNSSISPDVDVDMYYLSFTAGQIVDFDIDTPKNGPGGLDSYLRLFDAQGSQLAFNDDAAAPGETSVGFDAYLRYTFATGGTYYIGVSNDNNTQYDPNTGNGDTAGGSIGTFRLNLQVVGTSATDPNDTFAEATLLGTLSTTPATVSASISPDTDVNIYRFAVAANQVVDFDIDTTTNGPDGLNSYLRLFDSYGQQLTFNDNEAAPGEPLGFDAHLRYTFATVGTYYIGVSNANNTQYNAATGDGDTAGGSNTTGSYQLIVQLITSDPDDTLSESTSLGTISTTPVIKNDTISRDIDVDMYRFTVTTGQAVDFDIDTTANGPGGVGSYLRLFDSQGQQIAVNDNAVAPGENVLGFDAYLRYTFTAAGTYFIGVSNSNNIIYDAISGSGDTAGGSNSMGSYSLTVQALPTDNDDALAKAATLGTLSATPVIKSDNIATDIDVDLFRFTAVAGQIVDFDIDTTQNGVGGVDSYLRLFDSMGQQLAVNDNARAPGEATTGFDAYLHYAFTAAGTYFIAVSNANNTSYDPLTGNGDTAGGFNTVGPYQLSVSAALPDTDDSIAAAIPLGAISTTPVTKNDYISPSTDVDVHSLTVTAGQTVDCDIDTAANGVGGVDSYLRLFNAQGQQLAFNNNATAPGETTLGFDAYLRFTFTTGGTFYIAVSNANNTQYDATTGNGDTAGGANSTGAYSLTVQGVVLNPTLTLTPSVASIPEFNGTATGTVARSNADASQALIVNLVSTNTAAAIVPPTVTIPAGQLTATFTITAVDDHVVDGTRNTTITATANGFVNGTQLIHVTDSDGAWHNAAHPFDVNNDTFVTPADALVIINYLNAFGSGPVPAGSPPPFYDVDSDNFIAPIDALQVINAINSGAAGEGESAAPVMTANSSAAPSTLSPTLVDAVFAEQTLPTSKRRLY